MTIDYDKLLEEEIKYRTSDDTKSRSWELRYG